MALPQQRFCPLCDRSFSDGEAVLRCEGCGVMHHPACWVKNGGCATKTTHQSVPVALGYPTERAISGQAPHPGEGTRVIGEEEAEDAFDPPEPIPVGSRAPGGGAGSATPQESEVVIGAPPPAMRVVPGPAGESPQPRKPPVASRVYAVDRTGKPMPRVYGGHRLLRYWYVPVAALVAVGVAFGVIWLAGLFGGDDSDAAGGDDATTTAASTASAEATGASGTQTPAATASAAPTGGKFQVNDAVVITGVGTGSGGEAPCLNIRTEPGTDQTIIDCLREGTQLTVLGGPQEAGGLTWWRV
ncbi:MAG: RING finger protein, partial [Tepidiformaceae bacterium]